MFRPLPSDSQAHRPTAEELFTDRDEERKLLREVLSLAPTLSNETTRFLTVFYGVGGVGKSTLCEQAHAISREHSGPHLKAVFVDFEHDSKCTPESGAAEVLGEIIRGLAAQDVDALRSARGITTLVVTLLAMAVMSGSLSAADTNRLAVPGRDDMSRYIGAKAKPGERSTQRDASGRALGTAATAGTRTTFRDSSGRVTGSATVEGNRKVFRDSAGRMVGTATTSGGQTAYRDGAGRAQGASSESSGRTTFRDAGGRTTSTVQDNGSNTTFRDNSGRATGSSSTTRPKK